MPVCWPPPIVAVEVSHQTTSLGVNHVGIFVVYQIAHRYTKAKLPAHDGTSIRRHGWHNHPEPNRSAVKLPHTSHRQWESDMTAIFRRPQSQQDP